MSRFERQIKLPGFGEAGQRQLQNARVLVVGAGGLGCPAMLYLAAAGVGTIGIADGDKVALSNLNRQVIFGELDCGMPKAEVAARYLREKYSDCHIEVFPQFLTTDNALDVIRQFDYVLDGSDNFPTRYMVNDACVLLKKPLLYGAVYRHEGQVAVFNAAHNQAVSANYRDLYPNPPSVEEIPNCAETGVFGVVPGLIGVLQAAEAIKLITGIGEPLVNKILFYRFDCASFYEISISPASDAHQKIPDSVEAFLKVDYSVACELVTAVDWDEVLNLCSEAGQNGILVDVREPEEEAAPEAIQSLRIPLSVLETELDYIRDKERVILFCQSGLRSLRAGQIVKEFFPGKKVFSVRGGMNAFPQMIKP